MAKVNIHKTAIVSKSAKLADGCEVGPYSIIENDVSIGEATKIGEHCFIGAYTTMGRENRIFTGAIVGSITQDLKYKGERSFLKIGDCNLIREYVTINRSTGEDGVTKIGSKCLFMAYTHVAHDCIVGDEVIMANCGTLGGHVTLEDKSIIGGLTGVHQFVKVGKLAIIGGCSKVVQDIPPFSVADGHPANVRGVNIVGLKRAGCNLKRINEIKKANKLLSHC